MISFDLLFTAASFAAWNSPEMFSNVFLAALRLSSFSLIWACLFSLFSLAAFKCAINSSLSTYSVPNISIVISFIEENSPLYSLFSEFSFIATLFCILLHFSLFSDAFSTIFSLIWLSGSFAICGCVTEPQTGHGTPSFNFFAIIPAWLSRKALFILSYSHEAMSYSFVVSSYLIV